VQIDDGSERHDLSLDPNQIANGSILYTPVSKDLTFQLHVVKSDGTPIAESMRIVNGSKAPLAAHVIASAQPKGTVANTTTSEKKSPSSEVAAARFAGKTKPSAETPKSSSARELQAGPPASNSVVSARTAPAKSTPAAEGSPAAAFRSTNSPTAPAVGYIAPRPLKQVMPRTINPASLAFPGPTDVEVAVMIDDRGHVTEARMLDSRPYDNQMFTDAALSAALEWVFEPARKNGKSVPSEHTIRFHFHSPIARQ
jgi:TonB family protein